ncbi:type I restriction enzyme S subunit [Dyadobacter jejuensis]|uniref:Type I restriction enzyme S subunit n=1 Tax=Dyadobacter jejuensis TaxID=1082580 RepID=A0A316AX32_9BACT|nr:restriction endonuclease subunit S [Dyadobacter jejuensis]PWJ54757.1 type I restriction enzyme S subunit [Dyadobacter jejuensis]
MAETKNTKTFYNTQIPSDWETPEFGNVFSFLKSYSFSREQLTNLPTNDGIRYIHYGDIHATYENEILDFEIEETVPYLIDGLINPESFLKENFPVLQDGDLIIADASEDYKGVCDCIELANIGVEKVLAGLHTFAARTSEKRIAIGYRTYSLKHEQVIRELRRIATGTSVYGVTKTNLSKVKIPLPPLSEQKAIAKVLSTADAAIHTTEKLIAQKELRKKWLMQQLLTGKKRLKGFGGEWKEMQLGEMFAERNDTKFFDLPLLSIGQNGVYPQDESIKKDTSNSDKSKYKRICPGDIGYNTMRMWQGRSALSDLEGIVSPAYTVVTPKKNTDSLYFSYLFKTPKLTNLFWRNSQGLVDDTLNCKFKDFSIVKVILPPTKEEQTAIAQVLQAADKEISLLKAKAEKLREQKKGMMQVLLTGKIRLNQDLRINRMKEAIPNHLNH